MWFLSCINIVTLPHIPKRKRLLRMYMTEILIVQIEDDELLNAVKITLSILILCLTKCMLLGILLLGASMTSRQ